VDFPPAMVDEGCRRPSRRWGRSFFRGFRRVPEGKKKRKRCTGEPGRHAWLSRAPFPSRQLLPSALIVSTAGEAGAHPCSGRHKWAKSNDEPEARGAPEEGRFLPLINPFPLGRIIEESGGKKGKLRAARVATHKSPSAVPLGDQVSGEPGRPHGGRALPFFLSVGKSPHGPWNCDASNPHFKAELGARDLAQI